MTDLMTRGPRPTHARVTVIMVHGRGGSAEDMLGLAGALGLDDVAWLAPQAAGNTWYPFSFMAPIEQNQPYLDQALAMLTGLVASVEGPVALLGFSQGACLSLEFAARNPRRYAGIVGLSGGLIGPEGTPRDYAGSFDGTPVLLGCSDVDPHIPLARVQETAAVFERMGADVDMRIYPRMGHTVNEDEIAAVRNLLKGREG